MAIVNPLYKESDFTFSGDATATQTNAGTKYMGLAAKQFANKNANFAAVTFNVTDGYLTVVSVDAVIKTAPVAADPIYDGSEKELVIPGEADGGTLYYAVNQDSQNVPGDSAFATSIPAVKETGSYYVWYKVKGDSNHNDLAPDSVRVILAEEDWVELTGSLYQNDGVTPVGDAVITLMSGNREIDHVTTTEDGQYRFIVPAGVYSLVAEYQQNTHTDIVTLFSDTTQSTVMSGGKTESLLVIGSEDGSVSGIAVGGLNEEAAAVRINDGISDDQTVSVMMTVEAQTEASSASARAISSFAKNKSFIFFEAQVEKTVDSVTTVLNETANVLEIAVPFEKVGRRGLAVYYYDSDGLRALIESDTKEEGTFYVDKENALVYIYSNHFATFAIGYTPYYKVQSSASLGSFKGKVTVTVTNENGVEVYKLENADMNKISFADIPKGQYTMTITWVDGVENTLTMPLSIGDAASNAKSRGTDASVSAEGQNRSIVPAALKLTGENSLFASPLMIAAKTDCAAGYADTVSDASVAYASLAVPYISPSDMVKSDPDRLFLALVIETRGYLRA